MEDLSRLFDLERELGVNRAPRNDDDKEDDVEALHQIRLTLKKIKALTSLVRPFARKRADEVHKRVQKLAKELNASRDSDVIQAWIRKHGIDISKERKRANSAKAVRHTQKQLMILKPQIDRLISELVRPKGELTAVIEAEWWTANKLRRRAKTVHRDTDFHRWRHEVKTLQFQLELLTGREVDGIKKLGSTLGQVHDLSLISKYVKQSKLPGRRKLLRKAIHEQEYLEKKALKSGKQIFNVKANVAL